jgi:hypothetical protein
LTYCVHDGGAYNKHKEDSMKNLCKRPLVSLLGIIAAGAVIALGLAGCDLFPVDPNILKITGITDEFLTQGEITGAGVFPVGTSLEKAAGGTGIVAVLKSIAKTDTPPYTATISLYTPNGKNGWAGSGTYDVFLIINKTIMSYRAEKVDFVSGTTTVDATAFKYVSSPPPEGANTLEITGITAELLAKGASGIQIGIFDAGTSPADALQQKGLKAGTSANTIAKTAAAPYTVTAWFGLGKEVWKDSGTFDVYLILTSGATPTYYQAQNVSFSAGKKTTVAVTAFEDVSPQPAEPNILEITGITEEFNGKWDITGLGVFPAGATPGATNLVAVLKTVEKTDTPPYTVTISIYTSSGSPWTGSGPYDVYLVSNETQPPSHRATVEFVSGTTTVAITEFAPLSP